MPQTQLHVSVQYAGADAPFVENQANPDQTVGRLKMQALTFFGLVEGPTPEGTIISYVLYHGRRPIDDQGLTLGAIAGGETALRLKLAQQVTQG